MNETKRKTATSTPGRACAGAVTLPCLHPMLAVLNGQRVLLLPVPFCIRVLGTSPDGLVVSASPSA